LETNNATVNMFHTSVRNNRLYYCTCKVEMFLLTDIARNVGRLRLILSV